MASIAGSIVIVGIAIGPSMQQSVTFHSASTPTTGNGHDTLEAFASAAFTYNGNVGYVGSSYSSLGM